MFILDLDTTENTSSTYITSFKTRTDNNQTVIKTNNIKITHEQGSVIGEPLIVDDNLSHLSISPTDVLIEEIQGNVFIIFITLNHYSLKNSLSTLLAVYTLS